VSLTGEGSLTGEREFDGRGLRECLMGEGRGRVSRERVEGEFDGRVERESLTGQCRG